MSRARRGRRGLRGVGADPPVRCSELSEAKPDRRAVHRASVRSSQSGDGPVARCYDSENATRFALTAAAPARDRPMRVLRQGGQMQKTVLGIFALFFVACAPAAE